MNDNFYYSNSYDQMDEPMLKLEIVYLHTENFILEELSLCCAVTSIMKILVLNP